MDAFDMCSCSSYTSFQYVYTMICCQCTCRSKKLDPLRPTADPRLIARAAPAPCSSQCTA
ncbi:Eukaryotic translation initiation factor 4 gamma 1 [Frankliniella fusca]|uniref:Eukaryotic translation initiation factor 4 gamma 1 n=1 Tax=Frankliniella fusca TaxID=407009 RepID=A0AAE1LMD0_9NEOP|nr:Eukaryotic translation initiation factor 4 gamma 1 [Frankliniella fusca]